MAKQRRRPVRRRDRKGGPTSGRRKPCPYCRDKIDQVDYKDVSLLRRFIKQPNTKVLFAILFVGWAVVFGIGLTIVPHEGASSPYGGIALIAMFTGFFIMMGFLWAVIGE